MKRTKINLGCGTLAVAIVKIVAGMTPIACAQLATLDKGHQLLVNSGLQIWGCDTGASSFTYGNLTNANMSAVMWSHGESDPGLLSTGQKWGKWVDYTASPAAALNATETAHYADLVAIQVGDEQQTDMESPGSLTTTWFQNARNGSHFNDRLLYVNSFFINSDAAYATFIANANPDAISFDAYPFGTGGFQPINWLGKAQQFRRHALSSYISGSGNAARPYGLYLQAYSSTSEARRDPGDLEMRWQQFTAWTLGYTFVDNFTVGGATSLFNGGSMSSPNQPRYDQFKESARQSLNLGPALVRLISYSNGAAGGGTSIVRGKDLSGNLNPLPISWKDFNVNDAPPSQRFLTGVSAVNLGTKNGGQPGDVYVGFFNPLHASFGDPAGTTYFMVTNALGAYLQDPTLLVTDTTQRVTMDFNFGASGINSLQRLSRDTGQVEVVPLTFLGGNNYRLAFNLDGGTGELFKYNDGTPFVGVPFVASTSYWDSDGNAANNNISNGSGLGGSDNWDNSANQWFNGTTNAPWTANNDAIFWGTAGTVTLSAPQSASSLSFKTDGYTIAGSTLTLTGPSISVDADATASIGSTIAGAAGLSKNGPGTLNLTHANSYTGGTTINEGVLGIISGSVGANPASPAINVVINNGATLRFNQNNLTLTAQRQLMLGTGDGVIDTAFSNGIAGAISGGTLTKSGTGTLTLSATNSHGANVISGGALQVSSDANLGAVPGSFTAGNVTLDGGTLRFGADFDIANTRGITLGTSGGTIDTQDFTNPSGYDAFQGGFRGAGDLIKLGSGTFFAAAITGGLNTNWTGRLILKEGTWKIVASDGLPYNAPLADGLQAGQVTLDGGTWQMGATMNVTNGRRGITVAAGGGTIDTQSFNLTWAGPLAGSDTAAVLNKIGSGILRFTGANSASTYNGIVNISEGTMRLDNGNTMGSLAAINLADVAGATLNVTGNQTIGSLNGGGTSGGNVTLSAVTLTAGGNNSSTTFSGAIGGSGAALTKTGSGTTTFTGANSYTGATTVAGGTLAVNGSIAGNAIVQSGATLAGSGAIGGTTTVQSGGTFSPGGSPGTMTVGGLTLQAGSSLLMEIGPVSDKLVVGGGVALSGTLIVSLVDEFMPSLGQSFTLVTAGQGSTGQFTTEVLPSFSNLTLDVIYNGQSVIGKVVPVLPGDFNIDGTVDAADYIAWRKAYVATFPNGYADWRAHFGETSHSGSGSSTVPEPAAWLLLGIGATMLLSAGRGLRFPR